MRTPTVPAIRSSKLRAGCDPLVMVTAYGAPGARQAHAAGVDLILVGDTLAMVVLGYEDTLGVTIEDIAPTTPPLSAAGWRLPPPRAPPCSSSATCRG